MIKLRRGALRFAEARFCLPVRWPALPCLRPFRMKRKRLLWKWTC